MPKRGPTERRRVFEALPARLALLGLLPPFPLLAPLSFSWDVRLCAALCICCAKGGFRCVANSRSYALSPERLVCAPLAGTRRLPALWQPGGSTGWPAEVRIWDSGSCFKRQCRSGVWGYVCISSDLGPEVQHLQDPPSAYGHGRPKHVAKDMLNSGRETTQATQARNKNV